MNIELYKKVEDVIERKVKPEILLHGGNIEIKSIVGKDIRIRLLGNCMGCPSAQITTEQLVEARLKEELGTEIGRVILVNEISEDILDFAKKLLNEKC